MLRRLGLSAGVLAALPASLQPQIAAARDRDDFNYRGHDGSEYSYNGDRGYAARPYSEHERGDEYVHSRWTDRERDGRDDRDGRPNFNRAGEGRGARGVDRDHRDWR